MNNVIATAHQGFSRSYLVRGAYYEEFGEIDKAIQDFSKALGLEPGLDIAKEELARLKKK